MRQRDSRRVGRVSTMPAQAVAAPTTTFLDEASAASSSSSELFHGAAAAAAMGGRFGGHFGSSFDEAVNHLGSITAPAHLPELDLGPGTKSLALSSCSTSSSGALLMRGIPSWARTRTAGSSAVVEPLPPPRIPATLPASPPGQPPSAIPSPGSQAVDLYEEARRLTRAVSAPALDSHVRHESLASWVPPDWAVSAVSKRRAIDCAGRGASMSSNEVQARGHSKGTSSRNVPCTDSRSGQQMLASGGPASKAFSIAAAAVATHVGNATRSALPPKSPRQRRRINISALGNGAYRSLYLQAVERCGGLEIVDDANDDDCDIYFVVPMDREDLHQRLVRLRPGSCVNHFPGMIDVCEKVSFERAIRQRTALCPQISKYVQPTWILPDEFHAVMDLLDETAKLGHGNRALIIKPEYGLQGHGIFIVRTRADLEVATAARGLSEAGPQYVCQKYISNPLTLDGFKFDLRIYVVVSSLAPLDAHLCREGIARFCTTPYAAPTSTNISVRTSHLTNYSLNSKEDGFVRTQAGASPDTASKRLLSTTLQQIAEKSNGRFSEERFWMQLEELTSLMLVVLMPVLAFTAVQYHPVSESEPSRCYHVLGLDVLLDSNYWPWLLEVNSAPAMDIETSVPVDPPPPAANKMWSSSSAPELQKIGKGQPLSPGRSTNRRARQNASPLTGTTLRDVAQRTLARASTSSGSLRKVGTQNAAAALQQIVGSRSSSTLQTQNLSASAPSLPTAQVPARSSNSDPSVEEYIQSPPASPPPPVAKAVRKKRKKSMAQRNKNPPEEEPQPRYKDAWNGYQPSKMRHRSPWPEICCCVGHSRPHRHAICEVDQAAKVSMMAGALQQLVGRGEECEAFTKVSFAPELGRVIPTLWKFVGLCNRLNGTRNGVSGASLRRVLQASEEVAQRPGGQGKGKIGQHEIDFITSQARHRLYQRPHPASAKMALFPLFDMMLEVSRRCCEKEPTLASASTLEKLDWLFEAIQPPSDGATASCPAAPGVSGSRGSHVANRSSH